MGTINASSRARMASALRRPFPETILRATGAVTAQRAVSVTHAEVATALTSFVGRISQHPPTFSAIKRDGVPLYKLARQGLDVETEARPVDIFSIEMDQVQLPEVGFTVHCSKGTYIRSLAHDLGVKLGCGAHLVGLTRLASGIFRLEDSVGLDELGRAFETGTSLFTRTERLPKK